MSECESCNLFLQSKINKEAIFLQSKSCITDPQIFLDWFYPLDEDALNVAGAGQVQALRAGKQVGFGKDGLVKIFDVDQPAITYSGLDIIEQDTNRHHSPFDINDPRGGDAKGWDLTGGTGMYPVAGDPTGANNLSQFRMTAINSEHSLRMSDVTLAAINTFTPDVGFIARVVGDVPYINIETNGGFEITMDVATGEVIAGESNGDLSNAFYGLGNGYFYMVGRTQTIGSLLTGAQIKLLNSSFDRSYLGDISYGIDIYGAHYSDIHQRGYEAPVFDLDQPKSVVTRPEHTDCYLETTQSAAVDRDYSIYFKIKVRTEFEPLAITLIGFYGDSSILPNLTGWAFVYIGTSGELQAVPINNNVFDTSGTASINLAAAPTTGDEIRFMLEVIDGQPTVLTTDLGSSPSPGAPTLYPANTDRFWTYFDDASTNRCFARYINAKRASGTGYTIDEMEDAINVSP